MSCLDPEKIKNAFPYREFIDLLRSEGFTIGVDHYLRLQEVIRAFGPDCPPERLKHIICPLFAVDREQQERFYTLFDRYFSVFSFKQGAESPQIAAEPENEKDKGPDPSYSGLKLRKWPYILIGVILLVIVGLLTYMKTLQIIIEKKGVIVEKIKKEDDREKDIHEIKVSIIIPQPDPDGLVLVSQTIPRHQRYGPSLRWMVILLPLIFFFLTELYRHRRRRLALIRQRGKRPPFVWPIRVEPQGPSFIKTPLFYSACRRLQARLEDDIYRLDIPKTIDNTIAKSGYPEFSYQPATRPPEYLILIDLPEYRNHFTRYAETLAKAFENEGLFVSCYYFINDPRTCFLERGDGREYFYLSELQIRCRKCRLIMFGSGDALLNPLSSELESWTETFYAWPDRALITGTVPREWGIREENLAGLFFVLPASLQGLEALARAYQEDHGPGMNPWTADDTLPALPDEGDLFDINSLRSYCGSKEVFQWLCACAVYPELNWHLTIKLWKIISSAPLKVEDLLRLIRLPWFYDGIIPDQVRLLLISKLDREKLQAVREMVFQIVQQDPPPKESGAYDTYQLNLATHRWMLDRKKRKQLCRLKGIMGGIGEQRIIRDYTLMTLLDASGVSPLSLVLPKTLHRHIFRHGLPLFGLKTWIQALMALLLSLVLFFAFRPSVPIVSIVSGGEKPASLALEFVSIPPGEFMMGSPEHEPGRYDNEVLHRVKLTKGFYLQKTEVTQGQWRAVMGDNPSHFKECGDDCPVEQVSWENVQEFIKRLNQWEGEGRYSLPTEAEWEYACRADTNKPFAFGQCLSTKQENYNGQYPLTGCPKGDYRGKTTPVGSLEPNAWGLYDMHGNVWEWCSDWYGDYPEGYGFASRDFVDPKGPERGSDRVFRGGSWLGYARLCRSAFRSYAPPGFRGDYLGFRLVRSLP